MPKTIVVQPALSFPQSQAVSTGAAIVINATTSPKGTTVEVIRTTLPVDAKPR